MTPNEIQNQINQLQAELDKLKDADTYFPEPGEVVWVSDDLEEWHKRIFIKFLGFNSSPYKCVWENKSNTTKNYLLGKNYITSDWAYCRRMDGRIIPFGKDSNKEWKSDRTHLLPDGYEFCTEEQAEDWVKVELMNVYNNPIQSELGFVWEYGTPDNKWKPFYRPIRKIQYHVAVHEAVTAEPNPYAVDWSNAPEWADSHCFNDDGTGNWGGFKKYRNNWYLDWLESNFTLPTGLDWKLSKTTRP
jgi:hypothetical protein